MGPQKMDKVSKRAEPKPYATGKTDAVYWARNSRPRANSVTRTLKKVFCKCFSVTMNRSKNQITEFEKETLEIFRVKIGSIRNILWYL